MPQAPLQRTAKPNVVPVHRDIQQRMHVHHMNCLKDGPVYSSFDRASPFSSGGATKRASPVKAAGPASKLTNTKELITHALRKHQFKAQQQPPSKQQAQVSAKSPFMLRKPSRDQ